MATVKQKHYPAHQTSGEPLRNMPTANPHLWLKLRVQLSLQQNNLGIREIVAKKLTFFIKLLLIQDYISCFKQWSSLSPSWSSSLNNYHYSCYYHYLYYYYSSQKLMYNFGKLWWKWKISLMGFVYRVVRVLKKPRKSFCLKPSIFWENCIKLTCPRKFYHRVMYIAPSSGHISLNFDMPNYSKEVWGCFLVSGVRMLHFLKDWWKFIQIHQYYTMGLLLSSL